MKTAFSKLFGAIRNKNYVEANELFRGIMEQKVADRLAETKQSALSEATVWSQAKCEKCGHKWKTSDHKAHCLKCGTGKYTTVTTPDGKVVQTAEK